MSGAASATAFGLQRWIRLPAARARCVCHFLGIAATLAWDEQTMMPPRAAALRGAQQALLAGIAHAWLSDPRIADWLESLEGTGDPVLDFWEDWMLADEVTHVKMGSDWLRRIS